MPYNYCGSPTNPEQTVCEKCRQNSELTVTVLPPEERENFQGLTIEPTSNGNEYHQADGNDSDNPHVYVRHFRVGSTPGGLLFKLILGGVFLLIILLALPLALILLVIFMIHWFLMRPKSN